MNITCTKIYTGICASKYYYLYISEFFLTRDLFTGPTIGRALAPSKAIEIFNHTAACKRRNHIPFHLCEFRTSEEKCCRGEDLAGMLFGNPAAPGSIWKPSADWSARVRRCYPPTARPIRARRGVFRPYSFL